MAKIAPGYVIVSAFLLGWPAQLRADTVFARSGEIVLLRKLTAGKKDADPILSIDGKSVYFVRIIPDPEPNKWDGEATQLLSVDTTTSQIKVLLGPTGSREPKDNLRGFGSLATSPDGRTIYFIATAWGTTGAVHYLELESGRVGFVCAGNDLLVVQRGEYQGKLLVQKHKYMVAGGSYDEYWLVDADGKEIGLAGKDRRSVEERFSVR